MLKRVLQNIFRREAPAPGFVQPRFRLFNKMYREPPYDNAARLDAFAAKVEALGDELRPNQPGSDAFLADELLAWSRVLGFLRDERFVDACAPYASDAVIGARIWRVYTLCWAAESCTSLEGDYVDIGCYDGATVEIMARYVGFAALAKTWFLYDLFDNPPEESRKRGHGPQLHAAVQARVKPLGRFQVIKGAVPDSFEEALPERIAFAQLDLNAAGPELACLERLHDRVVPGGIIVLDDYGFARYRASQEAEKRFFEERGATVLELPTGQGLFIKRR